MTEKRTDQKKNVSEPQINKKSITNRDNLWILFILLVVTFFLWLLFPTIVDRHFQPENPGVFGDTFGSFNALFASMAFVGLIYTIWLQHIELGLQREELKLAREELSKQTEMIYEQIKAAQSSYNLQVETSVLEHEPILIIADSLDLGEKLHLELINRGEKVTDIKVDILKPPGLELTVENTEILDGINATNISISGSEHILKREIILKIYYTTIMKKNRFKMFRRLQEDDRFRPYTPEH